MELPFLPDRDFYTMREASRLAQVPPHTLRYWENRFGDLKPSRKQGGHRRYSRVDLELILEIKDLLQRRKMTVAGARRALIDRRRGKTALDSPLAGAAPGGGAQSKLLREVRKELKAILAEMGR
ncbi:MAG: MerR family transcriptional regulator [Elusimicrobia bacterium]|nr:MerR family transcriptional regulator [Elusimicrobiota bacterium]